MAQWKNTKGRTGEPKEPGFQAELRAERDEALDKLARVREWRDAKRKHGFRYPALDAILDGEDERKK